MNNKLLRALALAGFILGLASPLPAAAQGVYDFQIYWNSDRPYYYDNDHHRHYMSTTQAQRWYQHNDPDYYRRHQNDWRQGNYQDWDRSWQHAHSQHQYQNNYGSQGNSYGH